MLRRGNCQTEHRDGQTNQSRPLPRWASIWARIPSTGLDNPDAIVAQQTWSGAQTETRLANRLGPVKSKHIAGPVCLSRSHRRRGDRMGRESQRVVASPLQLSALSDVSSGSRAAIAAA